MHCPSCVQRIETLLEPYANEPTGNLGQYHAYMKELTISWLDHTISFAVIRPRKGPAKISRHLYQQLVKDVIEDLEDGGGFEVELLKDGHTEVSFGKDIESGATQHGQRTTTLRSPSHSPSTVMSLLFPWRNDQALLRRQQERARRHLESCTLCQQYNNKADDGNENNQNDAKVTGTTPARGLYELTLSVEGMTCASCTGSIASALDPASNPGIRSVNVNLLGASVTVVYDPKTLAAETISDMVEDAGFGSEISLNAPVWNQDQTLPVTNTSTPRETWKTTLSITGMTCASCTTSIAEGLKRDPRVKQVDVNLLEASAVVIHLIEMKAAELLESVRDLGFEADVVSTALFETEDSAGNDTPPQLSTGQSRNRTVRIGVEGIFCSDCVRKLNLYLDSISENLVAYEPFAGNRDYCIITYRPRDPYTVRQLVEQISNVAPEFDAQVVKPVTAADRGREIQRKERWVLFWHFLFALIVSIPTFIIGIVGMLLLSPEHPFRVWVETYIWSGVDRATLALWSMATLVQFGVGRQVQSTRAKSNWKAFFTFGSMDLLVVLSTTTAYFASLAMLILDVKNGPPQGDMRMAARRPTFFDSSVFLIMFILGGRVLEAFAKSKTTSAIAVLGTLRPATALLLPDFELDAPVVPDSPTKSGKTRSLPTDSASTNEPDHLSFRPSTSRKDPVSIPVNYLEYDDVVLIRPGDMPPADGIIVEGSSYFDESSLTGEALLVEKTPGVTVMTGTVNRNAAVTVRVAKIGQETMIEGIIRAVSDASSRKAPIEKLAERITGVFVPVVVYLAIVDLLIWLAVTLSGFLPDARLPEGETGRADRVFFALQFAIAVIVVACPCGIGLAAPCAQAVGTGIAAVAGILAAGGGEAFQRTTTITDIVFDKTGTLTQGGELRVTDVTFAAQNSLQLTDAQAECVLLQAILIGESRSSHPLAAAVVEWAKANPILLEGNRHHEINLEAKSIAEISGKGITATFTVASEHNSRDIDFAIGNERLMQDVEIQTLATDEEATLNRWKSQAKSVIVSAYRIKDSPKEQGFQLGHCLALADVLRPEAIDVIQQLKTSGYQVHMLSGDNKQTAQAIASQVGIPQENVIAEVLAEEKGKHIADLQQRTRELVDVSGWAKVYLWLWFGKQRGVERKRSVMFVGVTYVDQQRCSAFSTQTDGLNDSVALATADVAVALSHGAQASIASADFVLLNSSLKGVPALLRISKKVYLRQKINFAWACIFNIVLIPLAAGVFYPLGKTRLPPVWAALAMALSSTS
ncbi:hypothetical protein QFC21_006901 [Naganishia friedmannii]|uniref:Uncharacterized protein n=1 Tax=Naganishia friedmannii TaxID=89922 RepID=A0ACC2UYU8_9TREE|nr:hypothetical protein QFC21_006901 [Naganishia friedmannii]